MYKYTFCLAMTFPVATMQINNSSTVLVEEDLHTNHFDLVDWSQTDDHYINVNMRCLIWKENL